MRIAAIFYTCVIVVFTFSCRTTKPDSSFTDFPGTESDSLVAYIERTVCFGICPVYSIRIFRSGYVLYNGEKNITPLGKHYLYLTPEQFRAIGEQADAIGYFDLNDAYQNPHLTDFPTVYTEVRFRGKKKKVTHYDADPPRNLVEMEKYLDSLFPPGTEWKALPKGNLND